MNQRSLFGRPRVRPRAWNNRLLVIALAVLLGALAGHGGAPVLAQTQTYGKGGAQVTPPRENAQPVRMRPRMDGSRPGDGAAMPTQTPGVGAPGARQNDAIRGPSQDGEQQARPETAPSGARPPSAPPGGGFYVLLPLLIPLVILSGAFLALSRRKPTDEQEVATVRPAGRGRGGANRH